MISNNKNQGNLNNPFKDYLNDGVSEGNYHYVRITIAVVVLIVFMLNTFGFHIYAPIRLLCLLSFLDFYYRLKQSIDWIKFLKVAWVDLFLCIPLYPLAWLTVGITIRCIKVIVEFVLERYNSAFKSMLIFGALLVTFATISIMQFENQSESNIKNAYDAVWWSICTITTVGYGDKFPVTDSGKIISIMLMISGIGLFGALVGYVSNVFTDKEKNNNSTVDTIEELSQQIKQLQETLNKK